MATMPVDCGSFNKTSYSGVTQYGTLVNFYIPDGATITDCSVSFTTHASGGDTADRAFSINGARAHSGWASAGSLNAGLLRGGNNTFRVTLKSQTPSGSGGTSCIWKISNITLTITYTEAGSGGTPPPPSSNIGAMNVYPTAVTAGGSINIAVGACDSNIGRHIIIYRTDAYGILNAVATYHGSAAASWNVDIPVDWCSYSPNDTLFQIRVEYHTYDIFSGLDTGTANQMVDVQVPGSVVPSISDFTATRGANGVDAAITNYVQNYSKVTLAMEDVLGAYGSGIASYKISGGGMTAYTQSATFGPFSQTGDIVFTAVVTDTRGRTATSSVTISVLSYSPPSFSIPEAWRSNYDGVKNQKGTYVRLKSGASFSSLEGQNAVSLKGRVYIKGGVAPAWETMAPDTELILGGGALLFTRTYIAQIQVSDLLESRITEFIIPTKKTGFSIMAGMLGAAIGKVAEIAGILDVQWAIFARGNPVCEFRIGGIYITTDDTSPEDLWPGTEWTAIAAGTFLTAAGTGYAVNSTGGEATHALTVSEIAEHAHYNKTYVGSYTGSGLYVAGTEGSSLGYGTASQTAAAGEGAPHNNIPPYLAVYMWIRTA